LPIKSDTYAGFSAKLDQARAISLGFLAKN